MNKEERIRKELRENGIEDNLFDLAIYYSAELARYTAFCCNRYRNHIVPKSVYNRENQLDQYAERLCAIYDMLDSLSDETVEFLRNTSSIVKNNTMEEINDNLLKIERNLDTTMSQCTPCRDLEYESVRLGEDSPMYKHLLQLRKIVDDNKYLLSTNVLSSFVDIKHHGHNCVEFGWCTEEEYSDFHDFIIKYNLTITDIEYMISYIEKAKRKIHIEKTEEAGNG